MKSLIQILKAGGKSFQDLIYPPLCLHCNETLEKESPIFCCLCQLLLESIDPSLRCPYCFSSEVNKEIQKSCLQCQEKTRYIKRIASVFDYEGPPSTLIKQLKYGGQSYLAKGGGAYLAAQFLALNWPMPDFIVPMPMARLKKLQRGYNQSELLATSLSELINCPLSQALRRQSGDFSQAGLEYSQRLGLKSDSFFLKNYDHLHDKILLIIDDVMTTGSSLNCCAEALLPCFPKAIYALTLCRTL